MQLRSTKSTLHLAVDRNDVVVPYQRTIELQQLSKNSLLEWHSEGTNAIRLLAWFMVDDCVLQVIESQSKVTGRKE
jgi:hypothetical protein